MENEKRLIDITPLVDECDECMSIEWNHKVSVSWADAEEEFKQRLLDAPVVDAVEVVRCGNCVKRPKNVEWGMCHVLCRQTHKDDFCSYGEKRRDGDGNE